MATEAYKTAVSEGKAYFVDVRAQCVAVRETAKTSPDYQGLHADTYGVVHYWIWPEAQAAEREEQSIKEAKAVCQRLNMEQKEAVVSDGMSFGEMIQWCRENENRVVKSSKGLHAYWKNSRLRNPQHLDTPIVVSHDVVTATWHVVETEAERLKREHAALVAMAKSIAGKKPWSTDGIEPRSVLIARETMTELGLD